MTCFHAAVLVPATWILGIGDAVMLPFVGFMAWCYVGDMLRWWRA